MKKLIPPSLRLFIRVYQRHLKDMMTGSRYKFVDYSKLRVQPGANFTTQITLSQPIYSTAFSENKLHNLKLAIQKIENLTIEPGKIISFWHLVGNPDKSRGYLIGRTLIQNQVQANYGGGLCQLAGLIYFLALKAGLSIVERSAHSQDIYTEATRFTPLGSDATVVYGYKDLRFENSLTVPLCFRFQVQSDEIRGMLCSPEHVFEEKIEFLHHKIEGGVRVETVRHARNNSLVSIVNTAIYKNNPVTSEVELFPISS